MGAESYAVGVQSCFLQFIRILQQMKKVIKKNKVDITIINIDKKLRNLLQQKITFKNEDLAYNFSPLI